MPSLARNWFSVSRVGGAVGGLVADRLWGEPAVEPHPVALLGLALARLESRTYRDNRSAGLAHLVLSLGAGAVLGRCCEATAGLVGIATATWVATSGKMLGDSALAIAAELQAVGGREDERLAAARGLLPTLVGRDPAGLTEGEIARAVVESVAENTVDAIVAPILAAAVFGGVGVIGHRVINTLDAMVGHHNHRYERFGWASARADDLAAWLPARVAVLAVAIARPRSAHDIWTAVRDQAPAHPSPNGGSVEAAFAAALGIRLGGVNRYGDRIEQRPVLGYGHPAQSADIGRAVRLSRDVSFVVGAAFGLVGGASWFRTRRGVPRLGRSA